MTEKAVKEEEKVGIEENFLRLEQITARMEQEEITLSESFRLFQEGMELVKRCGDQLQDVEKQMIILETSLKGDEESDDFMKSEDFMEPDDLE